jgi:hypothetical protein
MKRRKASLLFAHMTACPPSARQSIDLCPTAERHNDSRKWNTAGGITALAENGELLIGGAFALKRVSRRREMNDRSWHFSDITR